MEPTELARAADAAWTGFWNTLMADAGTASVPPLPFDAALVARALDLSLPAPAIIPAPRSPSVPKPPSSWAQQLRGDERISHVTLSDVLVGLEDYFKIFRQMKKCNLAAYEYFSRVGAPLCFGSQNIFKDHFERALAEPIVDPQDLPSYLGLFLPRSRDEARTDMFDDRPSFLDFQLYEKRRRNIAVASPWKWVLFDHQMFSLDRDIWTKAERRRFPAIGTWGFHYYIGVDKEGRVSALPMRMNRDQYLPNGGEIHHSSFVVPPGLKQMAGKDRTVNDHVTLLFAAIRSFAASAMSGVQLSVRRGGEVARFGIPIGNVRAFFKDRDPEGARRRPLLHLVEGYEYQRGNKLVTVGEHLRGARHFKWRDFTMTLSAPGIHHAAPEAMACELLTDEDILPLPSGKNITTGDAGAKMQHRIETAPKVPIRRGVPTKHYRNAHLGA